MRPSLYSAKNRSTISVTGGNTFGLTKSRRATSSQARSTSPMGTNLVRKGMPAHEPAQAGEVEAVEEVADRREPDHHCQHGVVGADAAVGKDEIAEAFLRRDELRAD